MKKCRDCQVLADLDLCWICDEPMFLTEDPIPPEIAMQPVDLEYWRAYNERRFITSLSNVRDAVRSRRT